MTGQNLWRKIQNIDNGFRVEGSHCKWDSQFWEPVNCLTRTKQDICGEQKEPNSFQEDLTAQQWEKCKTPEGKSEGNSMLYCWPRRVTMLSSVYLSRNYLTIVQSFCDKQGKKAVFYEYRKPRQRYSPSYDHVSKPVMSKSNPPLSEGGIRILKKE